jgi:hypothetical protein
MESEDEEESLLVDLSTRVTERTLALLDGNRTANEVARALQPDFGGFHQKIHRHAMKLMDNLLTVGLLQIAGGEESAQASAPSFHSDPQQR